MPDFLALKVNSTVLRTKFDLCKLAVKNGHYLQQEKGLTSMYIWEKVGQEEYDQLTFIFKQYCQFHKIRNWEVLLVKHLIRDGQEIYEAKEDIVSIPK